MNTDQLQGQWNQIKGEAKRQWADLTDDDLLHIEGDRDKFLGVLQEKYGQTREDAEEELDDFLSNR